MPGPPLLLSAAGTGAAVPFRVTAPTAVDPTKSYGLPVMLRIRDARGEVLAELGTSITIPAGANTEPSVEGRFVIAPETTRLLAYSLLGQQGTYTLEISTGKCVGKIITFGIVKSVIPQPTRIVHPAGCGCPEKPFPTTNLRSWKGTKP